MKSVIKILFLVTIIFTCSSVFSQKFTPVKEIPEGKALVYIYRLGSMRGAAVHYTVNANEVKVSGSHLRNKTYLVFFAEPGRYFFWARVSDMRRVVDIDVEAGKTYYVRGNCCEFIVPEVEKAKKEIVKCKLPDKTNLSDTVNHNNYDIGLKDTLIIQGISFYFKPPYTFKYIHEHSLVIDFSKYKEAPATLLSGDVKFSFELNKKDFTMYSSISRGKLNILFRFHSSGSLRRFGKLSTEELVSITFESLQLTVHMNASEAKAFNQLFAPIYKVYGSTIW